MTEPRDPRELLGMLAARVQHFAMAPGGIPKLTPQDLAAAIASIQHPVAAIYARVKYAGQTERGSVLTDELFYRVALNHPIAKWKIPRKGFIRDMCGLALAEDIDPHTCRWCNGRKDAQVGNKVVTCDGCQGSGRMTVKPSDRARLMGLTRDQWEEWADRYKEIQREVDIWDSIVGAAIVKRMWGR